MFRYDVRHKKILPIHNGSAFMTKSSTCSARLTESCDIELVLIILQHMARFSQCERLARTAQYLSKASRMRKNQQQNICDARVSYMYDSNLTLNTASLPKYLNSVLFSSVSPNNNSSNSTTKMIFSDPTWRTSRPTREAPAKP